MIREAEAAQYVPSPEGQQFLNDELRILDRYELQDDLVETLLKTEDFSRLAPFVARCHRSFRHWRCENGHDWAVPDESCSTRICPHCSRRRSLKLAARMENMLIECDRNELRYVVFAEQNSTDLGEGIRSLFAAWDRLRRWVPWLRKVRGAILALEVTRNREDGTWHPHLNVLIEGDYFPFEELNKLWIKATRGRGRTSHIQAADAGTVRELIKYVTKISDLVGDPFSLNEFLHAVERCRFVRTYGTFYGVVLDEDEGCSGCPDCQTQTTIRLGYVPPHQISLDFHGVFRVALSPARVADEMREAVQFPPSSLSMNHFLLHRLAAGAARPLARRDGYWYDEAQCTNG